jgi:hypothetical protein
VPKARYISSTRLPHWTMWQYLWAHAAYHLVRWFPRNDRVKIRLLLFLLSCAFLAPLFMALLLNQSTRYCSTNLFDICVASICFTLIMIGFTILFTLMEPVPWRVKFVFHLYGLGAAILGVILLSAVIRGQDTCVRQYSVVQGRYTQICKGSLVGRVCSCSLLCVTCLWNSLSDKYRYASQTCCSPNTLV